MFPAVHSFIIGLVIYVPPTAFLIAQDPSWSVNVCVFVSVSTYPQETVQGSILHIFCDNHDGFTCAKRGGISVSHHFTCMAHKLGMTSVCYTTEAAAKWPTLTAQHHIDFRFIF